MTHLSQEDILESSSFLDELLVEMSISSQQVLEGTTVRSVGHLFVMSWVEESRKEQVKAKVKDVNRQFVTSLIGH